MSEISREEAIQYLCGKYLVVGSPINGSAEKCEHHNQVIDKAIDDMEKLEKIEQFFHDWENEAVKESRAFGYMVEIEQILRGEE